MAALFSSNHLTLCIPVHVVCPQKKLMMFFALMVVVARVISHHGFEHYLYILDILRLHLYWKVLYDPVSKAWYYNADRLYS